MKNKLCLLATFLFAIKFGYSQSWSTGSNILKPVRGGNIAAYSKNNEGYLFIVSGREEEGVIKTLQRYTVSTNTWDTLNPHPTGLLGAAVTVLKDNLFIIGGVIKPPGFGQDTVYKFDIAQNKWLVAAPFPYAIVDAKAVSYQDSLIYVAGGLGGPDSANIKVYNINTNSWRTGTTIPSPEKRNFGGFAIADNKLIYMCGTDGFGSENYFNTVYVGTISDKDRSIITWKLAANFPGQTRSFFDAHPWRNNTIIMTGGSTDNTFDTWSDECYIFKPDNNSWTQLPNKPTAWLTGQSGTVHLTDATFKLICAGGYNSSYLYQTEILTDIPDHSEIRNFDNVAAFSLLQNAPNPFTENTRINYEVSSETTVSLTVYDALGKQIETLVDEKQRAGKHTITFNAKNLVAGIYYYKLKLGYTSTTKKMSIVKP